MEHEGKYLEYKETVSRTYLKTVSAFANYGPGTIIFGLIDYQAQLMAYHA